VALLTLICPCSSPCISTVRVRPGLLRAYLQYIWLDYFALLSPTAPSCACVPRSHGLFRLGTSASRRTSPSEGLVLHRVPVKPCPSVQPLESTMHSVGRTSSPFPCVRRPNSICTPPRSLPLVSRSHESALRAFLDSPTVSQPSPVLRLRRQVLDYRLPRWSYAWKTLLSGATLSSA
jgi:hypothetical protein